MKDEIGELVMDEWFQGRYEGLTHDTRIVATSDGWVLLSKHASKMEIIFDPTSIPALINSLLRAQVRIAQCGRPPEPEVAAAANQTPPIAPPPPPARPILPGYVLHRTCPTCLRAWGFWPPERIAVWWHRRKHGHDPSIDPNNPSVSVYLG